VRVDVPLIPVSVIALIVAAFAWRRRGCEIGPFFGQTLLVAYWGYLGFVIERAPAVATAATPPNNIDVHALAQQWPLLLVAGVPFALVLCVFPALPVWLIPQRRTADTSSNTAFWKFVEAQNQKPHDNGG
jgi:hypothetical protein